ncbi:hypothetical protein LOK49_LG09G00053 [Camellia lanceoleosa]|uniref:Uncharacterized protein n=1 Tax=Camellia lanceoleosa TaxID=1840588 RepID=A0ACC0GF31_9ERIC|nr:hypothetical protein LOK49_LG09G00053 [Camellia lanceoleosa]
MIHKIIHLHTSPLHYSISKWLCFSLYALFCSSSLSTTSMLPQLFLLFNHILMIRSLSFLNQIDLSCSLSQGQEAYSILVLPDEGTTNTQCESQLLFLGHSEVPNSTDGQMLN